MRARPAVVNEQKVSSEITSGVCHSDLHLGVLTSGPTPPPRPLSRHCSHRNRSVRQRTEARVSPIGAYTIFIIGSFHGHRWLGDHRAFAPMMENAPCTPI
jgi:hypothetical protein